MQQNQPTPENAKSMPCLDMPTVLMESSDHSGNDQPGGRVKSLIRKFASFQGKLHDGNVRDFKIEKKPFIATACKKSSTPLNDCLNMEGDAVRVNDFKNIAENQEFKIFTATTHLGQNPKSLQVETNATRIVTFGPRDNKPNADETADNEDSDYVHNALCLAKLNEVYRQCLKKVANRHLIKNIEHVRAEISTALKEGEESEFVDSELIKFIKNNTKKLNIELDSRLKDELNNTLSLTHHTRLSVLQSDLKEYKEKLKIQEDQIALMEMENKSLLDQLNSYGYENVDRVSLEQRIKFAQKKNDKLKRTIASIFERKMLSMHDFREDSSSNGSHES